MELTLSMNERKKYEKLLSYNSKIGGYFLIFLALFLFLLALFGLYQNKESYDRKDFIAFITLEIFLILIGFWLLFRSLALRKLLSEKLQTGIGTITGKVVDADIGIIIQFKIEDSSGELLEADFIMAGYSKWEIGEKIDLIYLANGAFFPRDLESPARVSFLKSPYKKSMKF